MSSHEVGYTEVLTVKIHTKKNKKQDTIAGPHSQREYVKYFNDVGKNDHKSSFYSTTIQTIRYYLRIFCWELDRVVHSLFVVVCNLLQIGYQ